MSVVADKEEKINLDQAAVSLTTWGPIRDPITCYMSETAISPIKWNNWGFLY